MMGALSLAAASIERREASQPVTLRLGLYLEEDRRLMCLVSSLEPGLGWAEVRTGLW